MDQHKAAYVLFDDKFVSPLTKYCTLCLAHTWSLSKVRTGWPYT